MHNKITTAQNLNLNHFRIFDMNCYSIPHTEPSIILLTSHQRQYKRRFSVL